LNIVVRLIPRITKKWFLKCSQLRNVAVRILWSTTKTDIAWNANCEYVNNAIARRVAATTPVGGRNWKTLRIRVLAKTVTFQTRFSNMCFPNVLYRECCSDHRTARARMHDQHRHARTRGREGSFLRERVGYLLIIRNTVPRPRLHTSR